MTPSILVPCFATAALPEPEAIRRTAEEVVRRPEFRLEPTRDETLILEWLWRIFRPIFRFLAGLWDYSPVLATLVVVLLIVILAALVAHIIYTFKQALGGGSRALAAGKLPRRQLDPGRLEADADEAANRHDYIGAVRLLFRAALLRLAEREKREPRPGITNREYLRRYRDSAVFEPLRQFVDVIDAKWYGHGACELQDYQQCRLAHATIRDVREDHHAHRA